MPDPRERLIVALDVPSATAAHALVSAIGESAIFYKVGLELFTAEGPAMVRSLIASGRQIFLDLKLHDIPNTAGSAARAAARLGVRMMTVHASGGAAMVRAAVEGAKAVNPEATVLGVTVLTSLSSADLPAIGVGGEVSRHVERLAELAIQAGCDGLVCSPHEVERLRQTFGQAVILVTPGVRPEGSAQGDQSRTATPAQAIRAGANHIVVGRPITAASDPSSAAKAILDQLSLVAA